MREYSVTYDKLTKKIRDKYDSISKIQYVRDVNSFVRSNTIKVETFHDLIMEIAELSYKNPDVMLFYRGQNHNYLKKKYFTLYPSIYRSNDINFDFNVLDKSADRLIKEIECNGRIDSDELREIKKIKLLQYSILQHYGVCKTPLLDVTQSIKVACSFAILDNKNDIGYIYILGLPYITGRISVDSEDYITNVRLLSISCSSSKRPFFQEGYLVQTEFTSSDDIEKGELDFNRRIVAIYEFRNNDEFWGLENPISKENLYPENDMMKDICEKIKNERYYIDYNKSVDNKLIGEFLTIWNRLEEEIRSKTQMNQFGKGVNMLVHNKNKLYEKNMKDIDKLRRFRNILVHGTNEISYEQLESEIRNLRLLLKKLEIAEL
ncbi:FRG domain-containing protein [Granulicatella sp.]